MNMPPKVPNAANKDRQFVHDWKRKHRTEIRVAHERSAGNRYAFMYHTMNEAYKKPAENPPIKVNTGTLERGCPWAAGIP